MKIGATLLLRERARWLMAAAVLGCALWGDRADAQLCRGNPTKGCTSPGTLCKPVSVGGGSSGHCTTSAGPPGEKSCDCVGQPVAPPPPLDPRCGSRTGTGTFTCTINEPGVTQAETDYPQIVFAPGDIVEVNADGCVQSGGTGSTWKRYVNPWGPSSDHLYHGLIRIPTGTPNSALVRIQSIISNAFKVTGVGVPESELYLHLGYEDDNYKDNGYDGHDNGTGNQCLTDPTNNVDGGPAHITITITRGAAFAAPPPTSRYDFDVLWTELDVNGLPLNPQWSWQLNPQHAGSAPPVPETSICHNFSTRGSTLGIPSPVLSPEFSACTDQADLTTVDSPAPGSTNAAVCIPGGVFESDSFTGHVNWFPITMEGHVTGFSRGADDDYTFAFVVNAKSAPLSVNKSDMIHSEFDSDETVDNFVNLSAEWRAVRDAVDNDAAQAANLSSGQAIVTGMFGLDGEHDLKSELHPVFALALKRDWNNSDPSDEDWLMFVRNQGDEGECSSHIWYAGFTSYTFRLPWRDGMASVDVNWNKTQFDYEGNSYLQNITYVGPADATPWKPAGVYVSFFLGAPQPRQSNIIGDPDATLPYVAGGLHLIWKGLTIGPAVRSTTRATAPAGPGSEADEDEIEKKIAAAIAELTPAQQRQMKNARGTRVTKSGPQPAKTAFAVVKLVQPPAAAAVAMHALNGGPASRKLQRDAAQMKALCAASHNAPAGLPVKVCRAK
jgi:hypothetical protein